MTDGYGRGFIHVLQGSNGVYTNKTFGGAGNSTVPPRFNTPHGINYDPRRGLVVISDRANARLVYVNIDGSYNSSVAMPEALALPCNVDFGFDNVHALVPNLGSYVQAGELARMEIVKEGQCTVEYTPLFFPQRLQLQRHGGRAGR